jgi:hypothetical protein
LAAQASEQLTKEQLAELYSGAAWREGFLKILDIASILRKSIITRDYRIPDEANNAIHLTQAGSDIAQALARKNEVPYKEAKLMCLLVTAYRDLLVDVERTNYLVLVDVISDQIKSGEIKHPFVFGRELYDKAADLFPDERKYLSVADTARLLEDTPKGVWQVGELVTGPYGIMRSPFKRAMVPHTNVPLQHCSDPACDLIHYVELTTDYEAPVNLHRPKLNRLLEAGAREPSDWNGFINDLVEAIKQKDQFDDLDPASLAYLTGDALADLELQALFRSLLDTTGPDLRRMAASVGLTGSAEKIAESLDRAELLQLMLCTSDQNIMRALDNLVKGGMIAVPMGEVRRARVNARARFGPWQLQAELSSRGVSFKAGNSALPVLRLHRLIRSLYDVDRVEDMQTLDWQLRHISGITPGAKLAEQLRIETPEGIIRNLVLATRENTERACESLGLPSALELADDDIVASLLWKLGFRSSEIDVPHSRFFERQDEIIKLASSAQLSSTVDEEPIRRAAAVFFQDLEFLLNDSLAYATWALTKDHYTSERPYVFRPSSDTLPAMLLLTEAAAKRASNPEQKVVLGELNTIYPLSRGFDILAFLLEDLRDREETLRRSSADYPEYLGKTELQRFPFEHVHPFLDIQPSAQMVIINDLREVSRGLLIYDVPEIRNSLTHFRRTAVDIARVIAGLEAVSQAVRRIVSLGFLRIPYQRSSTKVDEWGRRTVTLRSSSGQEVSFTRPSTYDWLPLPHLSEVQYLMHSALFAEPNEVLRFRPGYDSPYEEMWVSYPRRREVRDNSVAKQSESGSGTVDATGRASTRTG